MLFCNACSINNSNIPEANTWRSRSISWSKQGFNLTTFESFDNLKRNESIDSHLEGLTDLNV